MPPTPCSDWREERQEHVEQRNRTPFGQRISSNRHGSGGYPSSIEFGTGGSDPRLFKHQPGYKYSVGIS